MTQAEYESQDAPCKQPDGSVMVERYRTWQDGHSTLYEVECMGSLYIYVPDEYGTLWTLDRDGNPKARSVFRVPDRVN